MSIVTFRLAREAAKAVETIEAVTTSMPAVEAVEPEPVCTLNSASDVKAKPNEAEKTSEKSVAPQPAAKPATTAATVKSKPSTTVSK